MRRFIGAPLSLLVLLGCALPGHDRPHAAVGEQAVALRDAFNADVDKVRIVALVSPNCGTCLRGAQIMQRDVFSHVPDRRLAGYLVWVPIKGATKNEVPQATRTVPDPRAQHYWDRTRDLVNAYSPVLGLDGPAWDVYLIYRTGVRWEGSTPPKPDYWMQQLGARTAPALNGDRFARQVRAILAS
ncbi:MAG: hypothetical protein ABJA34_12740 [Pseudonocardiales bacterium]